MKAGRLSLSSIFCTRVVTPHLGCRSELSTVYLERVRQRVAQERLPARGSTGDSAVSSSFRPNTGCPIGGVHSATRRSVGQLEAAKCCAVGPTVACVGARARLCVRRCALRVTHSPRVRVCALRVTRSPCVRQSEALPGAGVDPDRVGAQLASASLTCLVRWGVTVPVRHECRKPQPATEAILG
jgi:hypothetical protein